MTGLLWEIFNILKEVLNRTIKLPELLLTLVGYGAPLTVFVVRSMSTHNGCSLGPAADYVTVEAKTLRGTRRLLAHEVAHACGLWHTKNPANLMFPRGPGEELTHMQAAVLRTSRHVTHF